MTSRQVHFATPIRTSGARREPSTSECDDDPRQTQALADWWGDFVPLEDWIPPRVSNRFARWGIKRYNMSPEVRIDTMNDHGDSTPDQYDRASPFSDKLRTIQVTRPT
ncbi:hypothetical protein P692DRAFT_20878714 [Suillus brevipes Sb2]|nr:hypothetical protein P692DRAFT_20878714 [Suillus brevipes Sb2]